MTPTLASNLTSVLAEFRMAHVSRIGAVKENITQIFIFQACPFQRIFDFFFAEACIILYCILSVT